LRLQHAGPRGRPRARNCGGEGGEPHSQPHQRGKMNIYRGKKRKTVGVLLISDFKIQVTEAGLELEIVVERGESLVPILTRKIEYTPWEIRIRIRIRYIFPRHIQYTYNMFYNTCCNNKKQ
jgi:hypothetical protein